MKHLLLGIFLLLCLSGTAQPKALLTAQDTLFIKFDNVGRKFTSHALDTGQTLYAVSKYFGLGVKDLKLFNPILKETALSIGTEILIPIPNRSIHRVQSEKTKGMKLIPIIYAVEIGDNLFDIAHRKFKMSVADFMKSNALESEVLSPGQPLCLGWFNIAGIDPSERQEGFSASPSFAASEKMEQFYEKGNDADKKEIQEQGMAIWSKDGEDRKDLFALHRSAPLGSVIAIENPMNNRIVYAKIVGRLPENLYEDKVRVVLSKKVGQFLGAVDTRFFVKIRYLRS